MQVFLLLSEPDWSIQSQENQKPPDLQMSRKAVTSNGSGSQITSAGFCTDSPEIKVQKCFICVTGMTCASCVSNVERHMLKQKGELGKQPLGLPGS